MSLDTAGCLAGLRTMFISGNFLHLRFSEILPSSEGEGGCCCPSRVMLYLSLLTEDSTSLVSLVQWEKFSACSDVPFHVFGKLLAFVTTTSSYYTEGLKPCGLIA